MAVPGVGSALVFMLASNVHFSDAAAVLCTPCGAVNATFANYTYLESFGHHQPYIAKATMDEHSSESSEGACQFMYIGGVVRSVNISVQAGFGSYAKQAHLLAFADCLLTAHDYIEHGIEVHVRLVKGVLSMCVNATETRHLEYLHFEKLVNSKTKYRWLSPTAMRWATIISCVIAILLAV
ncbi:GP4 glycoprotein [African pouched rat arterivirus]|uniref:GP4 glycoprotein n=1 Tax=African pouched rat arterivirus TaxID=1965064 RepID=A0A0B5JKI0_9NIDO|nr:GP4 glycoprotein [African pouched rat arterivirus]AJG06162.1 GP4 glycoprotein [African pouched rat arterivirus]